jgi:hypothetical protein
MRPACSVPHRIRIRNAVSKSSGKLCFRRRVVLHHTHTQPVAVLDQHRRVVVQVEQRRGCRNCGAVRAGQADVLERSRRDEAYTIPSTTMWPRARTCSREKTAAAGEDITYQTHTLTQHTRIYFFFETSFVVLMLERPRVQQRAQAERFAAASEHFL